ncbi:MAG: putative bicarbonate transporter, IctB family [Moorea sp. SIO2B7]|nr:putative bicarbonate transporter, IctB family [Moorena sp. SIO2B7]
MNSAWARFVLSDLYLSQWRGASYLYRLVGLFSPWRQGSWLLQWSEAIGALLISLVLILGPFVSTSLIGLLLIACGGYWGLLTLSEDDKFGVTPIHLLVLLYWCIATVAVAFSPVKSAAFSGWVKLTLYLLMFVLSARVLRPAKRISSRSPQISSWIITSFLLVALVVSVYGVRQQFFGVAQLATWNDPNSLLAKDTRVYSYLGNPNLLAGYLLSAIALSMAAVFVWRSWLQKALALTMVIVNSSCLYFTDSRGGWLGMLALILVFLLLLRCWWKDYFPPFWQTWLLPIVFGGLAALLIGAIVTVEPLRLRVMSIFAGRGDSSNNFRINVWEAVLKMIRDRPLIGIGIGNEAFNKVYPLYMRPKYTALSAYSIFLETAVEMGLIGLGCFLWLIMVTFNQGVCQLGRLRSLGNRQGFWLIAAIAAMAGMLTQGIVDTVWYRPQIHTLWWLMVAIIASHYNPVKRINYRDRF